MVDDGQMSAQHWRVLSGTCLGATHQLSGAPNEDAVAVHPPSGRSPAVVLAVSDGHGCLACFRSDVGSRIAVSVATDLGPGFLAETVGLPPAQIVSRAELELVPAIVAEWRAQVYLHAGLKQTYVEGDFADQTDDVLIPYGATLIMALLNEEVSLLLQIGDGEALTVFQNGQVHAPIPPDERLTSEQTTSLCLADAETSFRIALHAQSELPALVVLSTDGYGDSFEHPAWRQAVGRSLLDRAAEHGADWIQQRVGSWLFDSAEAGGDDVTVAIALRGPKD